MNQQTEIFFPVHANSLIAYSKILPELTQRESEVLEAMKKLGCICTGWDLINYLGRPYHTFSGRITALKKKGAIVDTGMNKKINGSTYSILQVI